MRKLLVASGNRGKLLEMRALLSDLPVELVTPIDLGLEMLVDEDGSTYVENAVKKAETFAVASGLLTLADDTGLEVSALGGAPGVHSKRYLPDENATDADRRTFLLKQLSGKTRPWLARFRAVVAISAPGQVARWAEGECKGEIIPEERGDGGFGYDAIFLVDGSQSTMAELDLSSKNRLSHRGRAIARALPILRELIS